jgi:hypothetical protein
LNVDPQKTPPSGLDFSVRTATASSLTPFVSLLLAQVGDALSLSDTEASAQGFPKELELHARMLVGAVTGLFWLSNPGAPASQVRDALNALPVYSSRVIALGSLHEQLHSAVQQLLRRMLAHVLKVGPIPLHYVQDNSPCFSVSCRWNRMGRPGDRCDGVPR